MKYTTVTSKQKINPNNTYKCSTLELNIKDKQAISKLILTSYSLLKDYNLNKWQSYKKEIRFKQEYQCIKYLNKEL